MMRVSSTKHILQSLVIVSFAIATLSGCSYLTTNNYAATSVGAPTDPNIKYIGRWDASSATVASSYWPGAYLKTAFVGTTVKIKLGEVVNIFVSIDQKADTFYAKAKGTVNLTPTPLPAGTHTLRVATYSEHDVLKFQGFLFNAGAKTVPSTISSKLIEFVGDSITAGQQQPNMPSPIMPG